MKAVVDSYDDDVTSGGHVTPVKGRVVGCTACEGTTVDPKGDRAELLLGGSGVGIGEVGCPDVEE